MRFVALESTDATRDFTINSCVAQRFKKVGQQCTRVSELEKLQALRAQSCNWIYIVRKYMQQVLFTLTVSAIYHLIMKKSGTAHLHTFVNICHRDCNISLSIPYDVTQRSPQTLRLIISISSISRLLPKNGVLAQLTKRKEHRTFL